MSSSDSDNALQQQQQLQQPVKLRIDKRVTSTVEVVKLRDGENVFVSLVGGEVADSDSVCAWLITDNNFNINNVSEEKPSTTTTTTTTATTSSTTQQQLPTRVDLLFRCRCDFQLGNEEKLTSICTNTNTGDLYVATDQGNLLLFKPQLPTHR